MNSEPQPEHRWLRQLVGDWTFESECSPGPDQPPIKTVGTESVRAFGELWTQSLGETEMGGQKMQSIITLGFDPAKKKFVGTFIATTMSNLWVYEGSLDATGKILTLDAEGPSFTQAGTSKYQDIFEMVNENERTLSSQILGTDGKWTKFLKATYRRQQ